MIKELINLASHLDTKGYTKEADYLDNIIKRAQDEAPFISSIDGMEEALRAPAQPPHVPTRATGPDQPTPKVAEDLITLLTTNGYEASATGRKQNESGVWSVKIYINKADEDGDSWDGELWLSTGSAQKSF